MSSARSRCSRSWSGPRARDSSVRARSRRTSAPRRGLRRGGRGRARPANRRASPTSAPAAAFPAWCWPALGRRLGASSSRAAGGAAALAARRDRELGSRATGSRCSRSGPRSSAQRRERTASASRWSPPGASPSRRSRPRSRPDSSTVGGVARRERATAIRRADRWPTERARGARVSGRGASRARAAPTSSCLRKVASRARAVSPSGGPSGQAPALVMFHVKHRPATRGAARPARQREQVSPEIAPTKSRVFHVPRETLRSKPVASSPASSTMRRLRTVGAAPTSGTAAGAMVAGLCDRSHPLGGEEWHLTTRSPRAMARAASAGSEGAGRPSPAPTRSARTI